ncbi:transposase [Mucilaginibacter dorajii]|uniref:Transposase n=1 Tax=Mucilaginibacter dorajii TaxID=692994 RepID=A0ABP7PNN6_9SPHI|nr:transposase [Mucilaginibacter dorajii]MCS3736370.1 REP element-mobilizing transposase RayT [Mucilaginibacter dorajii]
MEEKFNNKFRIPAARLSNWDYGSNGLYYITICTKQRLHYFGDIVASVDENQVSLNKTTIGEIAYTNWIEIPIHHPFIELDEFILMPNHLHGIIFINRPDKIDWQLNKFGAQSKNLASAMRGYKASVKTYATTNEIEFSWQPRYFDRVIRNEKEYQNVREYIFKNPENWLANGDNEDNYFPM